jgi:hypothetical protein
LDSKIGGKTKAWWWLGIQDNLEILNGYAYVGEKPLNNAQMLPPFLNRGVEYSKQAPF